MKKLLLSLILILSIAGFSATKLVLWTAPNPQDEMFWKEVLTEWKKYKPDIEISWTTIPAAGSSEEAILSAIASGRTPDICGNIFAGFAAQLVEIDQIIELNKMPDYDKLIQNRTMKTIMEGWKLNGKNYVIPIYSNPILMWWRIDVLKKLGYSEPPRTYSELYELSKKFVVPKEKYAIRVIQGRNWWDRWYDYITYYYAASEGKPYIDTKKSKVLFGNDAGKQVTEFISYMFKNNLTALELGTAPLYTGSLLGSLQGPWEIPYAENQFPDILKNIVITPPLVPDSYPKDKPVYTFADTKGIVIFKSSKHQKESWEFVKWVLSNEQFDKRFLEITKMPPAREDLMENPIFNDFFIKNPLSAEYAKYVKYAVPPALITKTVEVQDELTVSLVEPLMYGIKAPQAALDEAVKKINKIIW